MTITCAILTVTRRPLATAVGTALAWLGADHAGAAYPKVPFDEVAHTADVVFVGTVADLSCRENDRGTMIFTDVTFIDVELVHRRAGVEWDAEAPVVLTHAGGTFGDRSIGVSDMPRFQLGRRYLLFTRDDGKTYGNPLIGGPQGMFPILEDDATGVAHPVTMGRNGIVSVARELSLTPPVERVDNGAVTYREPTTGRTAAPKSAAAGDAARTREPEPPVSIMTLETFKAEIQRLLELPPPVKRVLRFGRLADAERQGRSTPRLPHQDGAGGAAPGPERVPAPPKLPPPGAGEPGGSGGSGNGRGNGGDGVPMTPAGVGGGEGGVAGDGDPLCYCGYFDLFLTMEQVPESWWSWQQNNDAMWAWNQFMDVYRYTDSDGTWGDNGENEFAGWPSDDDLHDQYGVYWNGALAKTFTTYPSGCPCCELIQADLMFNPDYDWTSSFDAAFDNSDLILYRPVVNHELGHTWGMLRGTCDETYDYHRLSVMHAYYSGIVEDGLGIHNGDAWAIRALYDDQTGVLPIVDVGVESYYANWGLNNAWTSGSSFDVGDSITLNEISVENMSSSDTPGVRLRVFLSTNDTITASDHQMGSYWYWDSFSSQGEWHGDVTTTIPDVPTGDYYVGLILTVGGDAYAFDDLSFNNITFMADTIHVTAPAPPNDLCWNAWPAFEGVNSFSTMNAGTDGPSHPTCQFDGQTYHDVWFDYTPPCSGTLVVSTCEDLGGWADYDTDLAVYSGCGCGSMVLAGCNDDDGINSCGDFPGYHSTVQVQVTGGQCYRIRVGGYSSGDQGVGGLLVDLQGEVGNDSCVSPILIGEGVTPFDTSCATTDGLAHGGCQFDGQTYNDVWYVFPSTCAGTMTVSTCAQLGGWSDYDTDLAVYAWGGGCPPASGQLLGCNDDDPDHPCGDPPLYQSTVEVPVTQGGWYLIRVGGWSAASAGAGGLSVACASGCAADLDGSGHVGADDLVQVILDWGVCPGGCAGDVDGDGDADTDDLVLVILAWGPC